MNDSALVRSPSSASLATAIPDLVTRTHMVRQAMESVMVEDTHYGTIPGTKKPTLYLAGAEKLLQLFAFAVDELKVEDLSNPPGLDGPLGVSHYRVRTPLRHIQSGEIVGWGLGECSSEEEKYKWRRAVSQREWDATPADQKRVKYGKEGEDDILQVRIPPADIRNTVLKMAAKRSLIQGTRTATACSDVFEQDLEDLAKVGVELGARDVTPPKSKSGAPPSTTPAAGPAGDGVPTYRTHPIGLSLIKLGSGPAISEPQRKRIFAVASAWQSKDISRLIKSELGVDMAEITKSAYEAVCGWFSSHKPGDAAPVPNPPQAEEKPAETAAATGETASTAPAAEPQQQTITPPATSAPVREPGAD